MKKFLLCVIAIVMIACLAACGSSKNEQVKDISSNESENVNVPRPLTNEEMYGKIIEEYNKAVAEYNFDDIDVEEKIARQYPDVSLSLVAHIVRYKDNGVKVTFEYGDIDKNSINELLVGADGSIGAIYSYDKSKSTPVKIFYQDTMERGNLNIYDNDIIFSVGSGGAALHYYEFGKIAMDGVSYELIESIEEEYIAENEPPVYRDAKTGNTLEYKSSDEFMAKYVGYAELIVL